MLSKKPSNKKSAEECMKIAEELLKNFTLESSFPNKEEYDAFCARIKLIQMVESECLKEQINGVNRYNSFFEKNTEFSKKYKAFGSNLLEVSKKVNSFNSKEFSRLLSNIVNTLKQCKQMAIEFNPDGVTINNLLDQMMKGEARSFAAIYYDAFRDFHTFPEVQELEQELNQNEASLKTMPKPTTAFEASFQELAFNFVKETRTSLEVQKALISQITKCYEAATNQFNLVRDNTRKFASQVREQFPREQAPASNLSANQTYTPGHFQPASQANNTVASLTQQTEAMKISGGGSPPKVR